MPTAASDTFLRATSLEELRAAGRLVVHLDGHTLALFLDGEDVHACDNRCPHMGFPLHRGTIKDGILTCHWHHARFDLCSGGTFDQWADDLRTYAVEVRDRDVLVDLSPRRDKVAHQRKRLRDGLERDIGLVIAKAVVTLADAGVDPAEPYAIGLDFGVRNRRGGWGQGLTMLTCFQNMLPALEPEDRKAALYHGLAAVAVDSDGEPPRFQIEPLPGDAPLSSLKAWFRQFVEVRDAEGAERCLVSAVRAGGGSAELADMLFAAATDHRYIRTGHVLDFTNKALEELLEELPVLLDRQQRVNEAGALVASYLAAGGDDARLLAALGACLVREDRDFHTIQCVEAAFRRYADLRGTEAGTNVLVAAARYLAAHSPTMRAERQTLDIARRLQRGERLYEDVA